MSMDINPDLDKLKQQAEDAVEDIKNNAAEKIEEAAKKVEEVAEENKSSYISPEAEGDRDFEVQREFGREIK